MRSLELKTLQIKDDIPLYVTLDSLSTWDKNENRYKFVTRNADSCVYTPVYMLKLYPSSSKEKIVTLLEYFFKVCDVGASPQCTWKTDDCDYISLLLPYTRYDQIKFDLVRNKILEQFPELLMPENCLEKLPDYGKTEDYIASIEVAYPVTWTIDFIEYDELCGMKFNSIKLKSHNGVSLLVRTDYDNVLYDYVVEVITKDGNHAYGCGDDLDVALATFNEYVESSSC